MSANIKTILIIGATSGLGEQFARRFHALGKKVIITGRRNDRLSSLKTELGSNVESYHWDITDFSAIASHASHILTSHPDVNAVFLVSGLLSTISFLDPSTSTESSIIAECNTNVTAQMLLTRIFIPHLSSIAAKGHPATFLLMGSGQGFVPLGNYSIYSSTKAALHALAITVRQQINTSPDQNIKENLSVTEVVAPYVDAQGTYDFEANKSAALKPMPLREYLDGAMAQLEETGEDGKPLKETAGGTAVWRVELWRESFGKKYKEMGIDC